MDYQFVILACSLAVLYLTLIGLFLMLRSELYSLKNTVNELKNEISINLDKLEMKRNNDIKDLNLRMEAVYSKLDNLLWRILNKS